MSKPLKLYSSIGVPNPPKVAIILEELGVPYETSLLDFPSMKQEPYTSVNPNGRVPAIQDPNTGITVWESAACIDYLLDTYDGENSLRYTSGPELYLQKSWMALQVSGQGPYYGQRTWFLRHHLEKNIKSAIDRYGNEIHRILNVLNTHLKKTGTPYLVGDKCTYADLAFVPWHWILTHPPHAMGAEFANEWETKYPEAWAWNKRLNERPAVKRVFDERKALMEAKQ